MSDALIELYWKHAVLVSLALALAALALWPLYRRAGTKRLYRFFLSDWIAVVLCVGAANALLPQEHILLEFIALSAGFLFLSVEWVAVLSAIGMVLQPNRAILLGALQAYALASNYLFLWLAVRGLPLLYAGLIQLLFGAVLYDIVRRYDVPKEQ